jgi:AcrR family transcriptional regulator
MTEKKEQILQTALRLFAAQGYDATPTSQIAREAGVSEGGMFRHFPNKEALMTAVLTLGYEKVGSHVAEILGVQDPKQLLARIIELPTLLISREPNFWALQMSLKWQSKFRHKNYNPPYNVVIFEAATKAFRALDYAQPEQEVELLFLTLEGLSNTLIHQSNAIERTLSIEEYKEARVVQLLKSKYGLANQNE